MTQTAPPTAINGAAHKTADAQRMARLRQERKEAEQLRAENEQLRERAERAERAANDAKKEANNLRAKVETLEREANISASIGEQLRTAAEQLAAERKKSAVLSEQLSAELEQCAALSEQLLAERELLRIATEHAAEFDNIKRHLSISMDANRAWEDLEKELHTAVADAQAARQAAEERAQIAEQRLSRVAWRFYLPTENDAINIASMLAFAWASFDLLGAFGLVFSGLGILFFSRTMRNLKSNIARDRTEQLGAYYVRTTASRTAQFGFAVCVGIECVAGFFDFLLFNRLLEPAPLPFWYLPLAIGSALFVVAVSLSALNQTWNETRDRN